MIGSRTVITAMSVLSVLALGACSGGDPGPKLAPPSSSPSSSAPSSPSTTAVSGPIEPTMPAAARGTDAAAAEAFVKFYWEMVNYAQATGDVEGLRGLTNASCQPCSAGLRALEKLGAQHAQINGGVYRLSDVSSAFFDNGKRIRVWYRLAASRQTITYPGGKEDQVFQPKHVRAMSLLRQENGQWTLEYWGDDPSKV